jgi:hypothetical protein
MTVGLAQLTHHYLHAAFTTGQRAPAPGSPRVRGPPPGQNAGRGTPAYGQGTGAAQRRAADGQPQYAADARAQRGGHDAAGHDAGMCLRVHVRAFASFTMLFATF